MTLHIAGAFSFAGATLAFVVARHRAPAWTAATCAVLCLLAECLRLLVERWV